MATIRDIAEHAQVSPGTVSQLLNGRGRLSQETRQRVQSAIRDLGYKRAPVGRPRQHQRRYHVALLTGGAVDSVGMPQYPLHRVRLQLLHEQVAHSGDQLSLLQIAGPVSENWAFRDLMEAGTVHGVLITGTDHYRSYADWLKERQIPAVVLARSSRHREFSSVCVDHQEGGALAARHFLAGGHRRLAFAMSDVSLRVQQRMLERQRGFARALRGTEAALVSSWHIARGDTATAIAAAGQMREQGVTGLFVASDGLAAHWIDVMEAAGIQVPQAMSVMGFDDADCHSRSGIRPTSIGSDNDHFVRVALRTLRQLIEEPGTGQVSVAIRPYVAEHGSTADGVGADGVAS